MTKEELIEQLARQEHRDWCEWMNHIFDIGKTNEDGSFTIPPEFVGKWLRQANVGYKALSAREKQMILDEVAHILPIIEEYKKQ